MAQHISYNLLLIFSILLEISALVPPKYQWKSLNYDWKEVGLIDKSYIPENNMPTGLARWNDKLFITIPRWKQGVFSSLNFIYLNGSQQAPLHPYPNWQEGPLSACGRAASNKTVISTFRIHIDKFDRLWVADNGVIDMATNVKQILPPSLLVFDLKTDNLLLRHEFDEEVLRDNSVLSSLVVEFGKSKNNRDSETYVYITDMGSNAIIVYELSSDSSWRVDNPYFHFDPHAGVYNVGGIDFFWSDGVSSAALTAPKRNGFSDLYFNPTSSTKLFKVSTELLRDKNISKDELFNGVEVIGDRGPKSQSTACDIDLANNVLYFTQVSKNGLGCWNMDKPYTNENTPVILSDCNLMEFPNDVKVDKEGNVWMLSDRQSKFMYEAMEHDDVNYRILMAPSAALVKGTACARGNKGSRSSSASKNKKSGSASKDKKSGSASKDKK